MLHIFFVSCRNMYTYLLIVCCIFVASFVYVYICPCHRMFWPTVLWASSSTDSAVSALIFLYHHHLAPCFGTCSFYITVYNNCILYIMFIPNQWWTFSPLLQNHCDQMSMQHRIQDLSSRCCQHSSPQRQSTCGIATAYKLGELF